MQLNEQQQAAVKSGSARVCVIAGAGSGKTRVIVSRVAHRIEQGADPSRICCVTFTRKAAGELKERLAALVGNDARHVKIGTFHSLCAQFIRRYADLDPDGRLTSEFGILDDVDSKLLLDICQKEIAKSTTKSALMDRRYSRIETLQEDHPDKDKPTFRIWTAYHQRLLSLNSLDFDSILEHFFSVLLRNADVFGRHADRFGDVLVDEHQDSDRLQDSLVKLAVAAGKQYDGNLFFCGDPRQSIYTWRGAEPRIMQELMSDPEWEIHTLNRNYRSTIPIVDLANRIESAMDFPPELSTGGLVTDRPGSRPVAMAGLFHADEAQLVAGEIREHLDAGGKPSDVAVLYRAHAHARRVAEALDEAEIPYYRVGSEQDIWRAESTRQIVRLLRLACNPADDQTFAWVANWPDVRLDGLAMAELRLAALEACSPMLPAASDKVPDLWRVTREIDRDTLLLQSLISLDSILHLTDPDKWGALAVENSLAIETIGEWAEPEPKIDLTINVPGCDCKTIPVSPRVDGPTVGDFLDWFVSRSMQDEIREERETVTLCTIHAAKGLEWPLVFLIGLEAGRFPNQRADTDHAEELRLFYVAVTRARDELFLSRATEHSRGGEIKPSRFLELIGTDRKAV